jgi:hypothetical protein
MKMSGHKTRFIALSVAAILMLWSALGAYAAPESPDGRGAAAPITGYGQSATIEIQRADMQEDATDVLSPTLFNHVGPENIAPTLFNRTTQRSTDES